jgi:hypothetical protein
MSINVQQDATMNITEDTSFAGSSPAMRTTFVEKRGDQEDSSRFFPCTSDALGSQPEQHERFPKRLKYRGQTLATIYGQRAGQRFADDGTDARRTRASSVATLGVPEAGTARYFTAAQ